MAYRRALPALGCIAIVAAFAHRVGAGGPVDVEIVGYEGAQDTHFATCSGSARMPVRYGGVGAEVRLHPQMLGEGPLVEPVARGDEAGEPTRGLRVALGGAVEQVSGKVTEATGAYASLAGARVTGLRAGVHATLGYDARYVGFYGGGLLYTPLEAGGIGALRDAGLPDLTLRLGRLDGTRFECGLGAYSTAVLARPGPYVGIGFVPVRDWDVSVRYGDVWSGGDAIRRLDLELFAPVSDAVKIGWGIGVQGESVKPEGRVLAVASF